MDISLLTELGGFLFDFSINIPPLRGEEARRVNKIETIEFKRTTGNLRNYVGQHFIADAMPA